MYPWLHVGSAHVSTYSLMLLCAYICGGMIAYHEAKRLHLATEAILQVALGGLCGSTIGAKLGMIVILGPETWVRDLPYLWYSGQTWTGGFFGGYAGVLLVKHWRGIRYRTGDVFALALPLGQAIGRVGNLLGGDPFGNPTKLPWGLVQHGVRRQPSAFYELVLLLGLFLVLLYLRDNLPRAGDLFVVYVIGYCSQRFLVDFTRADMRPMLGLTVVQLFFVPTIVWFSYRLWRSYQAEPACSEGSIPAVAAA